MVTVGRPAGLETRAGKGLEKFSSECVTGKPENRDGLAAPSRKPSARREVVFRHYAGVAGLRVSSHSRRGPGWVLHVDALRKGDTVPGTASIAQRISRLDCGEFLKLHQCQWQITAN